jgi:hypothetical protein
MPELTLNGDPGIDAALDDLLALADAPHRLKAALGALSEPARLVEFISPGALRLAVEVASPAHFQPLLQHHPGLHDRLIAARDFVVTALPGLALASAFQPAAIAAATDDGVRSDDFARTLRSVGHANLWIGPRNALQPAVRIVLTDITGERAFDEILDWADLLFVANSFLRVLADSTEDAVGLVSPDSVGSFFQSLPESREQILAALREIEERASELRPPDAALLR